MMVWFGIVLVCVGNVVVVVDYLGINGCDLIIMVGSLLVWDCVVDLCVVFDIVKVDFCIGLYLDMWWLGVVGFLMGGFVVLLSVGVCVDIEYIIVFCQLLVVDVICVVQVEVLDQIMVVCEQVLKMLVMVVLVKYVGDDYVIFGVCVVFLMVFGGIEVLVFVSLYVLIMFVCVLFGDVDIVVLLVSNGQFVVDLLLYVVLCILQGVGYYDFFVCCIVLGCQCELLCQYMEVFQLCMYVSVIVDVEVFFV